MDRRDLLRALAVVVSAAAPFCAWAQQARRTWRVASVHGVTRVIAKPYEEAFLAGMRTYGYVPGQNLIVDARYADGDPARYPALVDEVLALKPDVLIGANTAVALVMKARTQDIPIVLATSGDPVGDGLVQSLARPGGNVTGVSLQLSDVGAKHVEMMGELLPRMRRVALLNDPSGSRIQNERYEELAKAAAAAKGWSTQLFRIERLEDVRAAFLHMQTERPDALITFLSPRLNSARQEIVRQAVALRLPSIAHQDGFAEDGGLMSYGPSFVESWRRVPYFVDRILKGAKPAELPIEQPTKFTLLINGKTAKALGLAIPGALLLRADRVIE